MHAADHQHMGQPCRPVIILEFPGDPARIPGDHGRQGPRRVPFQVPAEGLAQSLLKPGGPGPEPGGLSQLHEAFLVPGHKHFPVGVPARAVVQVGDFHHKDPLDLLPGAAGGQVVAPAAEVRRLFPGPGHPQPGPGGAVLVAVLDLLHRGGEGQPGVPVAGGEGVQPALGMDGKGQPQGLPCQQPGEGMAPAGQLPPQDGCPNKESRKRPKGHLRLKSSHQLRGQRTGKQPADRPPHPISGGTGAAAPGR